MKKQVLWPLGLILLLAGILLNRLIEDFPAAMVAILHTAAVVCLILAYYRHRKEKN